MILRFARAWLAVLLVVFSACNRDSPSDNPGHEKLGAVRVALRATAPNGVTYRLREGRFAIAGTATAAIYTEDAPDAELREQALVAGNYTITLAAGWFLEGLRADGTWVPAKAKLVSPNPVDFAAQPSVITDVR